MKNIRHINQRPTEHNLSRRRFIQAAAAIPLFLALPNRAFASPIIHQLHGLVYVNNRPANLNSRISSSSRIVVAHDAELVFSIGGDAFLLREGTAIELVGSSVISGLRLLTGGLLSVFDKRSKPAHIVTRMATIGIRGTGLYVQAEPNRLYTCTCYGETDLIIGRHTERIVSSYHNAHEVIHGELQANKDDEMQGMKMKSMAVVDHTDDELRMLEAYVGRIPAFDQ
jgi:hypothetical protein